MKKSNEAILRNQGVDTGNFLSLHIDKAVVPEGAEVVVMVRDASGVQRSIPVANPQNKTGYAHHSMFYQRVMEDGYLFNPRIHRRFIAAQFRRLIQQYGELIDRIYRAISHMAKYADTFVREAGCITRTEASKSHFEINAVSDIALWHARQTQFQNIPATQVKRLIAGHGKASKEQVAKALQQFVHHPYENYDESDAVALGIASLILGGYTSRNTRPDNCRFIEPTAKRVAYA